MRLPKRKTGKYAGLKADPHLTIGKYKELEEKLVKLKTENRPRVIAEMQLHAQDGDFSENAPYQAAKARLRGINRRILETEDLLKRAIIIERPTADGTAQIGGKITVEIDGRIKTYLLLGPSETDPSSGVISHASPLGSALIGKREGETAVVRCKDKTKRYLIIKIE